MTSKELKDIIEKEGDKRIFYHRGIRCTILRPTSLKNLCGYIDLVKEIPEYGKDYDSISLDCHGGLTYAGKEGKFWRIGFDCGHSGDLMPYMLEGVGGIYFNMSNGIYRDMEYVESELISMVDQLDRINNGLISKLDKKRIRETKIKGLVDE